MEELKGTVLSGRRGSILYDSNYTTLEEAKLWRQFFKKSWLPLGNRKGWIGRTQIFEDSELLSMML